ncbi:putative integral membrane protein [Leucobacter sp. 7(1)]|uniref:hypothetical protein n=1 Tax=Leucobacter sp. 7(1) TaxID=1255613 RepID=UPI00097F47AE|nr:hypothetical protein [Leucobacter sp. 7(1)]SJN07960.1 putative integral membrane protein [Leucobacter sp. 7(1)]
MSAASPLPAVHEQRLRELERENRKLRAQAQPRRVGRSVLSALALTLAVVLAPVAVLGSWVRVELVDTERFVATLAPLATDPAVQGFLSDEVMTAVDAQVDFDGIVDSVVSGLTNLGLPQEANAALTLLTVPAAQGMRSVVATAIDDTVASDAFAGTWQLALTQTHRATVALMQGNTHGLLTLDRDTGTLALEAGVIVDEVKAQLEARGMDFASMIPSTHASIPLTTSDALVGAQLGYTSAVAVGAWLPWVALGLLVGGIALARRRTRALARTSIGLVAAFLLLAGALSFGAAYFEAAVSPGIMPLSTASALSTQLTASLRATLAALAFAAALIGVTALLLGPSRGAIALRSALSSGFARVRAAYAAHGVSTGAVGSVLDRFRSSIFLLLAAAGVLIIFLARPVNAPTVAWVTVGVIAGLVLVELLRRPASEVPAAEPSDAVPSAGSTQD